MLPARDLPGAPATAATAGPTRYTAGAAAALYTAAHAAALHRAEAAEELVRTMRRALATAAAENLALRKAHAAVTQYRGVAANAARACAAAEGAAAAAARAAVAEHRSQAVDAGAALYGEAGRLAETVMRAAAPAAAAKVVAELFDVAWPMPGGTCGAQARRAGE